MSQNFGNKIFAKKFIKFPINFRQLSMSRDYYFRILIKEKKKICFCFDFVLSQPYPCLFWLAFLLDQWVFVED